MQPLKAIPGAPARRKFSLADVHGGRLSLPRRIVAYGVEGVGKSTFAAGAPSPVFICPENGTPHLDVKRAPTPETWDELLEIVSLFAEKTDYRTLVIDPVNWLESLAWARVVGGPHARPDESTADAIAKHGGGFNKGYEAALGHWRALIAALERAWKAGMHIVLVGHAAVKPFQDPSDVAYDRYAMQMHQKAAGILTQWADDVLFMRHEVLRKIEGGRAVAVSTGMRVMHTQWNKAWDAKSRASIPEELPLSWDEYMGAVLAASVDRAAPLKKEIAALIERINDAAVTEKATRAVSAARDNPDRLAEVANALQIKLASST